MASARGHTERVPHGDMEGRLAVAGWGFFLLWVGLALLLGFGSGVGLLGAGVITLGVQAARRRSGLAAEGFWIVVGLLFVVGGLAAALEVDVPIVPIVLVAGGVLLLASVLGGMRSGSGRSRR